MVWNPFPAVGRAVGNFGRTAVGNFGRAFNRGENEYRTVDPTGAVAGQARAAGAFADAGERGYRRTTNQLDGVAGQLERIAGGEDSLSAEQLRQGLERNVATQQALAAAARPGNAGMAMRSAMRNAAAAGAGMSGDAALAGIQERRAATDSLGNLLGQMRGQDISVAQGGRGQALQGYGAIEQQRGARFGALTQTPTTGEQLLGGAMGLATLTSDERVKGKVADGREDARALVRTLAPRTFEYSDPALGRGRHVGVMAQDIERSPVGRAMVQSGPGGVKTIDAAKLAGALAAVAADQDDRLRSLEQRRAMPRRRERAA